MIRVYTVNLSCFWRCFSSIRKAILSKFNDIYIKVLQIQNVSGFYIPKVEKKLG